MLAADKVRVLERMRELLADPARVVLDPLHCFEREVNGEVIMLDYDEALERRDSCRVCFCGAASLACFEILDRIELEDLFDSDEDVIRPLLRDKALDIGVTTSPEVRERWPLDFESSMGVLTSALIQGRAVEVVDAALADLKGAA